MPTCTLKTRNRIIAIASVVAAVMGAGSVHAQQTAYGASVGPIWNQLDADVKCPKVAREQSAEWTGNWWHEIPGHLSVCELQPQRLRQTDNAKPVGQDGLTRAERRAQRKARRQAQREAEQREQDFIQSQLRAQEREATRTVRTQPQQRAERTVANNQAVGGVGTYEAGPIWDDADAVGKCKTLALKNEARWTGQWRTTIPGQMSVCQLEGVGQYGGRTVYEAGPIWSDADSQIKCAALADKYQAPWSGEWWTTIPGKMSVCELTPRKDYIRPIQPVGNKTFGEVEAGPIWDDADAVGKCKTIAYAQSAVWTGEWRTTIPGTMSVCGLKEIGQHAERAVYEAGPIWSDQDAQVKCLALAKKYRSGWNGEWWTTVPGKMSVCELDPRASYVPAAPSGPRYTDQGTVTDVNAGPIWDDADAVGKCKTLAYQRSARWTGQWRTTVPGQSSVCGLEGIGQIRSGTVYQAGPIWSDNDARQKCAEIARLKGERWAGEWWTTVPGQMSVCQMAQTER